VQHLLRGYLEDRPPPSLDRTHLPVVDAFGGRLLQPEAREQILATDGVLDLGRLDEHVDERVAMLDDDAAVHPAGYWKMRWFSGMTFSTAG
jgi:hypothetical protein